MKADGFLARLVPRTLAAGVMALAVLGCSGPGAMRLSSEPAPTTATGPALGSPRDVENLRSRAAAFWAARMTVDATKQWELLEPRGRGRLAPAEYGGVPRAVKYLAYQVEEANVIGYFATVKIRLIVQPVLPIASQKAVAPSAVVIEDKWVRIQGTWYRALEQEDRGAPVAAQR
jgi:hypothetical protein